MIIAWLIDELGTQVALTFLLSTFYNAKITDLLVEHIQTSRHVVAQVKRSYYPFIIHAWVVLPEHLHCVIELHEGDADFKTRWMLIKMLFSRAIPKTEHRSAIRIKRRERGIWQRRYWEHLIRVEADFKAHVVHVHIPLKHGLVKNVADWKYSTFHRLVKAGIYPRNWAGGDESVLDGLYDED